jgi:hypothetical protein
MNQFKGIYNLNCIMAETFEFMNPNDVKFENIDEIELLVIDPSFIYQLDHNEPGYLNEILKSVNIQKFSVNPNDFLTKVGELLENEKYASDDTQIKKEVIHDEPNFLYEIIYLDIDDKEKITKEIHNGLGTLLNTEENHIFGKVILIKSNIPENNMNTMSFSKVDSSDIYNILNSRVNTKVVIYEDGEFREEVMNGQIDVYSKRIFNENFYLHKELPFLLHNLNIHYTHDDYGEEFIPNLVKGKVDLAVFYTMTSDELRGNLTLDELKKIITLSNKLDTFVPDKEILKEEKDDMGRDIIKNKYRILQQVYNINK